MVNGAIEPNEVHSVPLLMELLGYIPLLMGPQSSLIVQFIGPNEAYSIANGAITIANGANNVPNAAKTITNGAMLLY